MNNQRWHPWKDTLVACFRLLKERQIHSLILGLILERAKLEMPCNNNNDSSINSVVLLIETV